MSRKRTPSQPTTDAEPTSNTAVAEPVAVDNSVENPTFAERVGERKGRNVIADPLPIAGDYAAGVSLFESRRDRQMAIGFDEKPGQPVIDRLKGSGFRWNPTDRVWTHPVRQESAMGTRIDAERLYQEVRQMIRQDKGIESGQEVPF